MAESLVEQPAGAFLMFPALYGKNWAVSTKRFRPIWFEDVDFCARLKASGLRAWYEPKAMARHTGRPFDRPSFHRDEGKLLVW